MCCYGMNYCAHLPLSLPWRSDLNPRSMTSLGEVKERFSGDNCAIIFRDPVVVESVEAFSVM